jgi:8-oxo-dGTP diphosphatase
VFPGWVNEAVGVNTNQVGTGVAAGGVAEADVAPGGVIDVVAWVCVADNSLLCARSRGQSLFYAPGGKPEVGETDVDALVREVWEELGVTLDPRTAEPLTEIVAPAHGVAAGRQVRMVCFTAEPHDTSGSPVASHEIAEVAWLGLADRDRCAPADQVLLDRLRDRGDLW